MVLYEDIKNLNEASVTAMLNRMWESNKYCKCDKCRRDVYTLALNSLKPHYTNSVKGNIYANLDTQNNSTEIVKTIATAMEKVGQKPMH